MTLREQLEQSAAIRQSYTRLPFQGFWTWLTGKELRNRAARVISPIESIFWAISLYLGGMAASVGVFRYGASRAWLLVSVILTRLAAPFDTLIVDRAKKHAVTPLGSREGTAFRDVMLINLEAEVQQK